ncbi:MAG: winged helix-turn-helix transcriptional regulator [Candidatus Bathyarchaeota archaeon]|nr:MAG: winged helix-turn-helix transcriptional regulator [Candidatus Bathyarchaeota archaeon]
MSEELEDELKRMKEELANMKEMLSEMSERLRKRPRGFHIDMGGKIHDYVEDVMEGVAEGISGELERSVFIGPHGIKVSRGKREEDLAGTDPVKAASAMSALGNEHRLKILSELAYGGRYISELQEKLPEITTSTLSSHLDVLEKAGLVAQEKVRGRYLITIPGRMAHKMAKKIARVIEKELEPE